tara:strand:- start:451 stop:585 length:135 start_codon:yes stop_codon:yes gene_type:complete
MLDSNIVLILSRQLDQIEKYLKREDIYRAKKELTHFRKLLKNCK